jgi:hypothetical protein
VPSVDVVSAACEAVSALFVVSMATNIARGLVAVRSHALARLVVVVMRCDNVAMRQWL